MIYHLSNDFVKLNETTGTAQNSSSCYSVELAPSPQDTGVILFPSQKISFSGTTIYARSAGTGTVDLRVVPFVASEGGGGSGGGSSSGGTVDDSIVASDDDIADIMDDIFDGNDDSPAAADPDIQEIIDDVFG